MRRPQLDDEAVQHERPAIPEQRLWPAALRAAIYDAQGPSERRITQESLRFGEQWRDEARRWLRGRSETLSVALAACDVDEDQWRHVLLPHLERRWLECDEAWAARQASMAQQQKAA